MDKFSPSVKKLSRRLVCCNAPKLNPALGSLWFNHGHQMKRTQGPTQTVPNLLPASD